MKPSHPEIEARTATELSYDLLDRVSVTSINLLEIHYQPNWKVEWNKNLDHDSLLKHIDNADVANVPALRILFLSPLGYHGVQIHPSTVNWLQDRFAVSSVFLETIFGFQLGASGRTGNAFLSRRNGCGKVLAIEGFYEISGHDPNFPKPHAWFLYDISTKAATYLIAHCSESVTHQIVRWAHDQNSELLSRPFAVDAFIVDDCSRAIQARLLPPRNDLVALEMRGASQFPSPRDMSRAFEKLHLLSQCFHLLHGDLTDIEEVIEFLLSIRQKYFSALIESQIIYRSDSSVDESLAFLLSRDRVWKRWIANYIERTQIRINLFFNLASQTDSRTQLEIAHLTSEIAIDTQRDSSSMITIAAVTLFFLPSTAICAVFSMVFFHIGTDATGRPTLAVSPQLWYFFAVAVPMTILVFVVWTVWQWYRGSRGLSVVSKFKERDSVA